MSLLKYRLGIMNQTHKGCQFLGKLNLIQTNQNSTLVRKENILFEEIKTPDAIKIKTSKLSQEFKRLKLSKFHSPPLFNLTIIELPINS